MFLHFISPPRLVTWTDEQWTVRHAQDGKEGTDILFHAWRGLLLSRTNIALQHFDMHTMVTCNAQFWDMHESGWNMAWAGRMNFLLAFLGCQTDFLAALLLDFYSLTIFMPCILHYGVVPLLGLNIHPLLPLSQHWDNFSLPY